MSRAEFSRATKRAARERSGGLCEATGVRYGKAPGERCGLSLEHYGVEFDHINPDANSHDGSLGNCAAVCKKCHRWKSSNEDAPKIAKARRQQDKHRGITGRKRPWPKRKFGT